VRKIRFFLQILQILFAIIYEAGLRVLFESEFRAYRLVYNKEKKLKNIKRPDREKLQAKNGKKQLKEKKGRRGPAGESRNFITPVWPDYFKKV
jgi:hypothetical protein